MTERKKFLVTFDSIRNDLTSNLCNKNCTCNCSNTIPEIMVQRWRLNVHQLRKGEQQQNFMLHNIRTSRGHFTKRCRYHQVEGFTMCKEFYTKVLLKIGATTYKKMWKEIQKGRLKADEMFQDEELLGERGKEVFGYIEHFLGLLGDPSPLDDTIIIPNGVTVRNIYEEYVELYSGNSNSDYTVVSESYFHKIWRKFFLPRVSFNNHGKIVKCNVCCAARNKLATCTDDSERNAIKTDLKEHLKIQRYIVIKNNLVYIVTNLICWNWSHKNIISKPVYNETWLEKKNKLMRYV